MKSLLIFFLILIGISGCTRKFPCSDLQIGLVFPPEDSTIIDTLVLKKYESGRGFQNLLDTFLIINGNSASFFLKNDSIYIYITEDDQQVKAGYNWQIYNPDTRKTIKISQIDTEKKKR